jgi:hypothetical protein
MFPAAPSATTCGWRFHGFIPLRRHHEKTYTGQARMPHRSFHHPRSSSEEGRRQSERPAGEGDRRSPTDPARRYSCERKLKPTNARNHSPWANLPRGNQSCDLEPDRSVGPRRQVSEHLPFRARADAEVRWAKSIAASFPGEPERSCRQHCPFERLAHLFDGEQPCKGAEGQTPGLLPDGLVYVRGYMRSTLHTDIHIATGCPHNNLVRAIQLGGR